MGTFLSTDSTAARPTRAFGHRLVPQDVFPGMESGEEGIRARLTDLREQLTRVAGRLSGHSGTVALTHREDALDLDGVGRELALLADARSLDKHLSRVHADLRDGLGDLLRLDLASARQHDAAADLRRRVLGFAFERSLHWVLVDDYQETLDYASSPLLRVAGGRFFQATREFVSLYLAHTTAVRSLHRELQDRCEALQAFTHEALEGHALKPPAGMDLDEVDTLHHTEFEQLVAALLDRDGYRIVRSGGGAGDMGADVLAKDEFDRYIMVQCKHFRDGNGSVGQPVAQHLYGGAVAVHPSTLAVVVTNGRITGGAKVWAKEAERVRLVDRDGLRLWAEDGVPLTEVIAPDGARS
ncbi:restriction endonuclease [Streptomyces sp. NPDC058659]|uniref:restriction endonuclease n=1 Tax=unclassified Streptomyces TaxID=2593676 RepID=UPI00365EF1CE